MYGADNVKGYNYCFLINSGPSWSILHLLHSSSLPSPLNSFLIKLVVSVVSERIPRTCGIAIDAMAVSGQELKKIEENLKQFLRILVTENAKTTEDLLAELKNMMKNLTTISQMGSDLGNSSNAQTYFNQMGNTHHQMGNNHYQIHTR